MAGLPFVSISEDDCTGSLGWPPRVNRTADTTHSAVLFTSRRERVKLLKSPLHDAALFCHIDKADNPLHALE